MSLKGILSEHEIEHGRVTEKATLKDDLNLDSLDLVEMTMAIEEVFGVTVSDEDAEKFITVGDVADYLEDRV